MVTVSIKEVKLFTNYQNNIKQQDRRRRVTEKNNMATTTTITAPILLLLALTGLQMTMAAPIDNSTDDKIIESCCDLQFDPTKPSGIYSVNNYLQDGGSKAAAYCRQGGWLVVQRRQDGSVDFNKTWTEYENGFGTLDGEFWLGLSALHHLTSLGDYEMMFDVESSDGEIMSFHYKTFIVGSAKEMYKLHTGQYQGTGTDPMAYVEGMGFTTTDVDNDGIKFYNCAQHGSQNPAGGWWYNRCWHINPNLVIPGSSHGLYYDRKWYEMRFVELKVRPLDCISH